jgi:hypothetical protein
MVDKVTRLYKEGADPSVLVEHKDILAVGILMKFGLLDAYSVLREIEIASKNQRP